MRDNLQPAEDGGSILTIFFILNNNMVLNNFCHFVS